MRVREKQVTPTEIDTGIEMESMPSEIPEIADRDIEVGEDEEVIEIRRFK